MNAPMKPDDLKPWMRGPFELIRHADGHLHDNGDTDRRIALIGFDNAIEVSIDVFIQLHPKLRAGIEIRREEADSALRNYHTKIEFLDRHVQTRQIPLSIPVDEIVWFHQLRNELYHSGNGMVPEEHVIAGARRAALSVFQALFGPDISSLLGKVSTKPRQSEPQAMTHSLNPAMEFLGRFIELERVIRDALPQHHSRPTGVAQMWDTLVVERPDLKQVTPEFRELLEARNAIVHGEGVRLRNSGTLESVMNTVLRILDYLRSNGPRSAPRQ